MIKLIGLRNEEADIEVSTIPSVQTYDIVSDMMADDCMPYRVAERVMIWLDPSGFLGEVEAIYPPIVTIAPCQYGENLQKQAGFPQFEVTTCDNEGSIQLLDDGFIVWFAKGQMIDSQIEFKNVQFLLAQDELIGIVARQASIIE